ncbi:hypothetical protein DU191_25925, partial [Salmonella enterica subsp. enterica serovar Sandiego]|nr:hypothetical protein [Salmonella enterica subsp. enterica serovar Sandiego]
IVKGMGMTWEPQLRKLNQRFSKGMIKMVVPSIGGDQEMVCLALRKLSAWLTTISPNKVRSDKGIASLFGTGLNEWKSVKAAHVSKIRSLVNEANMLIDFVLADTGKGRVTRT